MKAMRRLSAGRASCWRWPLPLVLLLLPSGCGVDAMDAQDETPGVATLDHATHVAKDRPFSVPARGVADLARLRAATAEYHDFTKAVAAGFVDASGIQECVAHPELGGMGIHYVHFDRHGDLEIDPTRPEILLYVPHRDGRMELVGAEFAVNAEAWHAAFGDDAFPEVAGVRFDPPDPTALNPLPQTSYTLHVWLWKENPAGIFAPFNPNVDCG
jgi:hypothetical protein